MNIGFNNDIKLITAEDVSAGIDLSDGKLALCVDLVQNYIRLNRLLRLNYNVLC